MTTVTDLEPDTYELPFAVVDVVLKADVLQTTVKVQTISSVNPAAKFQGTHLIVEREESYVHLVKRYEI